MESSQILVVDDEELYLKLMFQILRKEGFFVRTAQSGEEAKKWLQREVFDLAIVDIRMEPADGFKIFGGYQAVISSDKGIDDHRVPFF
ncbi:MAG: response regulator [Nitrospiria bacterium]